MIFAEKKYRFFQNNSGVWSSNDCLIRLFSAEVYFNFRNPFLSHQQNFTEMVLLR